MVTDQIKRKSLNQLVAAKIKRHIQENGLKPGDRLPTEQAFADRFGVSRPSIREVTKALGFLGIIDAAPRRGLTVGEFDINQVSELLDYHFTLSNYPKEHLLRARVAIETGVLSSIMQHMDEDPSCYHRLVEMNDKLKAEKDHEKFIQTDMAFHRALLTASGIEPLMVFNDLLQSFFQRFHQDIIDNIEDSISLHKDWAIGAHEHRGILDALHDGKLYLAQQKLRRHLEYHLGSL